MALKRTLLKALSLMPQSLRYALIRRGVKIVESELASVEAVRIAATVDEYVDSMRLVYDGYVARGILKEHDSKVRMTPYVALPSTAIFVAIEKGQVAGTLSLVKDGPFGLPMGKIYQKEVQSVRNEGRVIAEVGALCVANGKRGTGIPFLLYKTMWLAARRLLNIDDLVIAVHPDAADLYCATLQFERIGPVRDYPSLTRSAAAVALRLRLKESEEAFKKKWSSLAKTPANPYWLYVERVDPQISLPTEEVLNGLRELHRKAILKLAALRPDIVLDLNTAEFEVWRKEMKK